MDDFFRKIPKVVKNLKVDKIQNSKKSPKVENKSSSHNKKISIKNQLIESHFIDP